MFHKRRIGIESFSLSHTAGTLNITVTNGKNTRWILPNGTIVAGNTVNNTVSTGKTILLCSNLADNSIQFNVLSNPTIVTFSLKDFRKRLTYYFRLYNCSNITGSLADLVAKLTNTLILRSCSNITGSLADLGGKITYYLDLGFCSNITGSLADLGAKITYYLDLGYCSNITGSLADLGGKITYYLSLSNCSLITGVYTPVGDGIPTYTYLDYTGLSTADMDSTLIAYAATTKTNGVFRAYGKTRSSASDDAISTLVGRGWTINGLTKV